jgi:uncharacterized protein with ParB-like and HNH nuclease domain/predicted transport protein
MQAKVSNLLDFLKGSTQLVIPVYQRNYSWTAADCRQLWDDVVRAGGDGQVNDYFLGSILYVAEGLFGPTSHPPLLIIDGQQRLITVSLLLAALAEALPEEGESSVGGFSRAKIRSYYLKNDHEKGDRLYKLHPSQTDRPSYLHVLGGPPPDVRSVRIMDNLALFKELLANPKCDQAAVCRGLIKLRIVDISLNAATDKPQEIFESINSTGMMLSQADLIRNYLLMDLEPARQEKCYENYWRPMERGFGPEAYATHFDSFMRHYLPVRSGSSDQPRFDKIYKYFKLYAIELSKNSESWVEDLLKDMMAFSSHYRAMALDGEEDGDLAAAFRDLRGLRMEVVWPLMLEMYHDYESGVLSGGDFLEAVRLVESYLFRRTVCSIPSNSLNKTFLIFARNLDKSRYLESFKAEFQLLGTYRRFPNDVEFGRELPRRDLYHFRARDYWPSRLENHLHKEPVNPKDYTIEHIMPQNPNLSREWQEELGPEWERIRDTWLHTLGNLTLTGYNSEYSDKPFAQKRDMPGGYKDSHLRLNKGLGKVERWDESAIMNRAGRMAELALKVWPAPALPPAVIEKYQEFKEDGARKLDYYRQIQIEPVKSLFEVLRQHILDLDSVVTEHYLKSYVSFNAETTLVDIKPGSEGLELKLNIGFRELKDPMGMASDASMGEKWGAGDAAVIFSSVVDLPYIMTLIRQAFDKQALKEQAD